MPSKKRLFILIPCLLCLVMTSGPELLADGETFTCSRQTSLPGDIPSVSTADQTSVDQYSWDTFLALAASTYGGSIPNGDTTPLWASWSSTVDVIETKASSFGARYYPDVCKTSVANYQDYRALAQVGKIADGIDEAGNATNTTASNPQSGVHSNSVGLTDPLIASNGTFLRYEILINEAAFNYVQENNLYTTSGVEAATSISFPWSSDSEPDSGAIVVKNAWMAPPYTSSDFHTEKLLIYTPAEYSSTGQDVCEAQTMALVGQHIARKTANQLSWTWSTFEHDNNAPDCTAAMPSAGQQVPNTSCPSTTQAYNLNPGGSCTGCSSCNAAPAKQSGCTASSGYCANQQAHTGYSQICRQITTATTNASGAAGYGTATGNASCATTLEGSTWANYELISSQWATVTSTDPSHSDVVPQPQNNKPFLANTTMESYEKSNCLSCHQIAVVNNQVENPVSTDFMYWLGIEVTAAND